MILDFAYYDKLSDVVTYAKISPDGRWLAFTVDARASKAGLYIVDLTSLKTTFVSPLLDDSRGRLFVWKPDNELLTFRNNSDVEGSPRYELLSLRSPAWKVQRGQDHSAREKSLPWDIWELPDSRSIRSAADRLNMLRLTPHTSMTNWNTALREESKGAVSSGGKAIAAYTYGQASERHDFSIVGYANKFLLLRQSHGWVPEEIPFRGSIRKVRFCGNFLLIADGFPLTEKRNSDWRKEIDAHRVRVINWMNVKPILERNSFVFIADNCP